MSTTTTGTPARCASEEVLRTSLPLLKEVWEFGWAQLWEVCGAGSKPLLRAEDGRPAGAAGDSSLEGELAQALLDRCAAGSPWLSGSAGEGGLGAVGRRAGRLGLFPLAALPLGGAGSPAALMILYGRAPLGLDPKRLKLAEAVAAQASLALRSAERCERLLEELDGSRQRLQRAEGLEALARLALGETHDFNNVLGLILGHAHLLRSRISSAGEALELLDVIERAVREATSRVGRLQGLKSEIARGPRVARLDLNDVAEEVARALRVKFKRSLAGGTTIELKKELHAPWPVLAQPGLLKEALLSMIGDSMRALPRGGKLTLRTWDDLRSVHLSVSDTMLAGSKASGQADRGGKRQAFTGGESFATACGLIKSIHGEVAVRSESGGGTTVTISLPKAEEATASLSPM